MAPTEPNPASDQKVSESDTRRGFVKRAVYLAPVLLTLPASPSMAQVGSASEVVCVFTPGEVDGVIVGGPLDGEVCS